MPGLPALDADFERWLSLYDPADTAPDRLLDRFVRGLKASGIAVFRASLWLPTAHPELWGSQVIWTEADGASVLRRPHSITATPTYLNTPGEAVHAARRTLRWRLDVPQEDIPYPLLHEVKAAGGTDYLIVPFPTSSDTEQPWVTLATRAPAGFSDAALARIEACTAPLAWKARLAIAESATESLLRVYLGPNAATRVLAGQFRRGSGSSMDAVIWFCDLRNFTRLGDQLPATELVQTLDAYFECVAGPIEEAGGEVLKFVGDAVLAVFSCTDSAADAASRALRAARASLAQLDALSSRAHQPLRMGIGLHTGEVIYGNIGGRSRLDFTVIGPAVNEASRVEAMCKSLGTPLLVTGAFTASLGTRDALRSVGTHTLRGVSRPQELFTLAELRA